jgi:hypothetical protein
MIKIINKFTEKNQDNYDLNIKDVENYDNNKNIIMFIDSSKYLLNNLNSYLSIDLIYKQLNVDIPRLNLNIFNSKILNLLHFNKILFKNKISKFILNENNYKLIDILALLSTQTSFAFMCIFLNKLNTNKEHHIISLNKNNININIIHDNFVIIISSMFSVLDEDKKMLKQMKTELIINLINKEDYYECLENIIFNITFI